MSCTHIPTTNAPKNAAYATMVCDHEIHLPLNYATRPVVSNWHAFIGSTAHTEATTSPSLRLEGIAASSICPSINDPATNGYGGEKSVEKRNEKVGRG